MIKAVIFDQDGIIFNNEPLVSRSYELLLKEYGKTPIFEKNGLIQPVGVRGDIIWNAIMKRYDIDEDIENLREKRRILHHQLLQGELEAMEGVLDILNLCKKEHLRIALATGSARKIVETILTKLNIEKFFDVIITGNDYKNSKPDPESFLLASERLQIPPQYCVVVEDSLPGVIAGKAAGMKVIAVPSEYSRREDFSKANLVLNSLKEITKEMLHSL